MSRKKVTLKKLFFRLPITSKQPIIPEQHRPSKTSPCTKSTLLHFSKWGKTGAVPISLAFTLADLSLFWVNFRRLVRCAASMASIGSAVFWRTGLDTWRRFYWPQTNWLMCMTFTGNWCLRAPSVSWMRHPGQDVTTASALVFAMDFIFLSWMARLSSRWVIPKDPPRPQQESAPSISTKSIF